MRRLYPEGKRKAFNITYDDGVEQDVRFVELLNRYALKGTFNLNSQLMKQVFAWTHETGLTVKRLPESAAVELYRGHEVASHTLTHPYMQDLDIDGINRQLSEDKRNLENLFGREVAGFAVPFDYYSDTIAGCAAGCGFEYARMSEFTMNYTPCREYYHWKTGFYHIYPGLISYLKGFLDTDEELAVCQIVGHSYDLDALSLWETMEEICCSIARQTDVWCTTNLELVRYLKAMDKSVITKHELRNESERQLWFELGGEVISLAPGEIIKR